MIVDASALLCVINREPDYERIVALLADSPRTGIGAPTLVEVGIVVTARAGARGKTALARVREEARIETLPFTTAHSRVALDAFTRFGKGRHPAALNFGDCCCYATARIAGEPLLCIGDDFRKTDLELVPLEVGDISPQDR
jgi:ribonuclease VapC